MSATPLGASQQAQSVSQAQIEDMLRNVASRVDAEGNLEHGAFELLSAIAANTTRHSSWTNRYTMTSAGAFTARRIIKGQARSHIRVFDIRIYGAGAATFAFTDEGGNTVLPSIRCTAANQVRLNSLRGVDIPEGKSLFIAQTGAVAAEIFISALVR